MSEQKKRPAHEVILSQLDTRMHEWRRLNALVCDENRIDSDGLEEDRFLLNMEIGQIVVLFSVLSQMIIPEKHYKETIEQLRQYVDGPVEFSALIDSLVEESKPKAQN